MGYTPAPITNPQSHRLQYSTQTHNNKRHEQLPQRGLLRQKGTRIGNVLAFPGTNIGPINLVHVFKKKNPSDVALVLCPFVDNVIAHVAPSKSIPLHTLTISVKYPLNTHCLFLVSVFRLSHSGGKRNKSLIHTYPHN